MTTLTTASSPLATHTHFDNPYSITMWQQIENLAEKIDHLLESMDVGLTMGGEPTFVAINQLDAKQWCTEALGPEKFNLADQLLLRFKQQFAPDGLHQYTQGKWYPNEKDPRWMLNCYWRLDNQPIWQQQDLLAFHGNNYALPANINKKFLQRIAAYLAINQNCIMPAYEDIFYNVWQQEKLLTEHYWNNPDYFDIPAHQMTRKSLKTQDDEIAGYVLPLHWCLKNKNWLSSPWHFKSERLYLIPGLSSIGYRLPLNDLALNKPGNGYEPLPETSLFSTTDPLPSWQAYRTQNEMRQHSKTASVNNHIIIPTALCTQIRDQKLFVFIPPIPDLKLYLELINSVELAASQLNCPVIIEGFAPPKDPRIERFNITPDPGVIEVNIHPAKNWQALVHHAKILFKETALLGLSGYKFMHDGRQIGTGGGNHITLGSSVPIQSPFLRKPHLLQSMITFWQHHPSLSYLFSGLFIGATCQAPRIDEVNAENLYELEIAFQQIPTGESKQYWLVDRLLRYLLVDTSGNNHRAEFCIDKLFSPQTEYGRQGLLELRAFEMTPHWQMDLVVYLLIRGLIAHFWKNPYHNKLIRWGNRLHDECLLPHFIWEDFSQVIHYLNQQGSAFQLAWFQPFFHFRFPLYGQVSSLGIQLELRMALEPWPVIGHENQLSLNSSRTVDSALERVQLKVMGLLKDNYIITCNRKILPLHPTKTPGEYVGGVRFKSWGLTTTLHPNIPIHTPLRFEIIDLDHMQSVGGCEYHVLPPNGQFYEKRPRDQVEAAKRITERFVPINTLTKVHEFPTLVENLEFPYTLDLRRK